MTGTEKIKPIRSEADYLATVKMANALCDMLTGDDDSPVDSTYHVITDMIGDWEDAHPSPLLDGVDDEQPSEVTTAEPSLTTGDT